MSNACVYCGKDHKPFLRCPPTIFTSGPLRQSPRDITASPTPALTREEGT